MTIACYIERYLRRPYTDKLGDKDYLSIRRTRVKKKKSKTREGEKTNEIPNKKKRGKKKHEMEGKKRNFFPKPIRSSCDDFLRAG